ncbi:MAG: sigma-70 family RNA polymerase sigma factor [Bryobacterales bacterium]|nr:sigma-70 family RNA polymerase sigma factor [Bryobacterales bacterium]
MSPSRQELTGLLMAWGQGDQDALDRLIPVVYQELRRLAHCYMAGEHTGHTLQTTALANETYLRLVDCQQVRWQDRAHFFAVSARLMRRILVDFARSRHYQKRGAGARPVSLNENLDLGQPECPNLVALDDALEALAAVDPRKSQVVELKFFVDLTVEEIAETLRVSPQTVLRDWKLAKVWLRREMKRGNGRDA